MYATLRALSRIALLPAVLLLMSPLTHAQKSSKQPTDASGFNGTVPERLRPTLGSDEKDPRTAFQRDSAETPDQAQRLDRELNEALIRTQRDLQRQAIDRMRRGNSNQSVWREIIPFFVFLVVSGALLWILHVILENKRWYKMVKVQSETHTKLLEKFGSSQEMLAYMESDAGRRFLEQPLFNIENKQAGRFPYGRILWSVQVGLVLVMLGVGLLFLQGKGKVSPEGDAPLWIFGTVGLTLGIGFVLSAGVSYALSKQLGLLERPKSLLQRTESGGSRG